MLLKTVANLRARLEYLFSRRSHSSHEGATLYNDILYRLLLGEEQMAYFYGLCEHQSTLYPHMPLRLLKYSIATIEAQMKQGNSKYAVIINIRSLYSKKTWNDAIALLTLPCRTILKSSQLTQVGQSQAMIIDKTFL